ncbi:MAG: hypothetical protein KDD69_15675 [Bdellovibrionales bacterium]|nr:hypothetical protein [Bdellovibrionales bacterium]
MFAKRLRRRHRSYHRHAPLLLSLLLLPSSAVAQDTDVKGGFFAKNQARGTIADITPQAKNLSSPFEIPEKAPPPPQAQQTDSFRVDATAQSVASEDKASPEPTTAQEDPAMKQKLYREMSREGAFSSVLKTAEELSKRMSSARGNTPEGAPGEEYYRKAIEAAQEVIDERPAHQRRAESHRF